MLTEDVLRHLRGAQEEKLLFRIGNVNPSHTSGRPRITFDGESVLSTRTYPYLGAYTPAANDRVLVALVGGSGVVLGKII